MRFIFEKTDDVLIIQFGRTAIGALLHHTNLKKKIHRTIAPDCKKPVISHADIGYIGLLVQGKRDVIEPFRYEVFFYTS